jgi:UDP-N-acetylmuramyl pentapeptide phosphotransferase/UDP-N-acetylglucosamine-1-phosphate transferase
VLHSRRISAPSPVQNCAKMRRMDKEIALTALTVFTLAAVGCHYVRVFALKKSLLDVPNARSLHTAPVPRIGGVALCIASWAGAVFTHLHDPHSTLGVWLLLSLPVFVLGLIDDLKPLSARTRMAMQLAVAIGFVVLEPLPAQWRIADWSGSASSLVVRPLLVVWIVGVLNIYNFMDGMDGLAGVQAIGAGLALALGVGLGANAFGSLALAPLFLSCAALGFLIHNWPKARLFLGDAGSTVLGFSFATLPILAARDVAMPLLFGPLALAPFLLDATYTLIRRARNRERFWEAHRTHLYQRAYATGLPHVNVLYRYIVWIVVSCGAALLTLRNSFVTTGLAVTLACLGLGLTWHWVRTREAHKVAAP